MLLRDVRCLHDFVEFMDNRARMLEGSFPFSVRLVKQPGARFGIGTYCFAAAHLCAV